jgi:hypothetical protein
MNFTDTKFMTAKEKELTVKAFDKFVKALSETRLGELSYGSSCMGMNELCKKFSKRLYNHLIQHEGFIAHYDRFGFFATYFDDMNMLLKFLKQWDEDFGFVPAELGSFNRDYQDVREEFRKIIKKYKPAIVKLYSRSI